ncbi:MAG: RraA family protein [Boseongicola sp.]|nr:RraA family protein [Boseongicola sp.]
MYEDPPLLTIKRNMRRPSEAQIASLQGVPSAVASDAMEGAGALDGRIAHVVGDQHIVGPALTAWSGAADLVALHACKRFITKGDVVIAAVDGHQGCAAFGDALGGMVANAGASAIVTDGPVRDLAGFVGIDLSVWATGTVSSTPYENGPGRVGLPVQIGGQQIDTGDMIIADMDGVVVVPFDQIDVVAERSKLILKMEADGDKAVKDGLVMPPSYDALLDSDRVKWVD